MANRRRQLRTQAQATTAGEQVTSASASGEFGWASRLSRAGLWSNCANLWSNCANARPCCRWLATTSRQALRRQERGATHGTWRIRSFSRAWNCGKMDAINRIAGSI